MFVIERSVSQSAQSMHSNDVDASIAEEEYFSTSSFLVVLVYSFINVY